ncbi:MAG: hypothetical protein ACR2PL_13810 [Dehalococcoidia bacterium]
MGWSDASRKVVTATIIFGIFDNVICSSVPAKQALALYVKLTGAQGRYAFRLDYVHVTTNRLLSQVPLPEEAPIADRLAAHELVINTVVPIAEIGAYKFRLFANEAYLTRAAFRPTLAESTRR